MRKILFFLLLCLCASHVAQAQQKMLSGFYYPSNVVFNSNGNWLGTPCDVYPFPGKYHIGEDMGQHSGNPVYAITSGTVIDRSYDANDVVNSAWIWVRHPVNGGTIYALYAHVIPSKIIGDTVQPGEQIAVVAEYPATPAHSNDHLHFGIRPAGELNNGWGRGDLPANWNCANQNKGLLDPKGFVAPYDYLTSHSPVSNAQLTDYYVNSVTGSDGNLGTSGSPFATVTKAVSAASSTAPTVIHVKGGRYKITSSLTIHKNIRIVNDGGGIVYVGK